MSNEKDNIPERIWLLKSVVASLGTDDFIVPLALRDHAIEFARVHSPTGNETAVALAAHRCPHFMPKGEDSGGAYNAGIIQDVTNDLLDTWAKDRLNAKPRSWYSLLIKDLIQRIANLRVMLASAPTGKVSEEDAKLAHELISEHGGSDNAGLLRRKIATALATVRKEAFKEAIASASAAPTVDAAAQKFDVKWRRPNTSQVLECHDLTAEDLAFRIRAVIRMTGSVELINLTPIENNAVSNHVFIYAGCSRQWTIDSDDSLECFFVGLCYWCIRKHQLTKDEIDRCLRSLLPAAASLAAPQDETDTWDEPCPRGFPCRYRDARQCARDTKLGSECPRVCACVCHPTIRAAKPSEVGKEIAEQRARDLPPSVACYQTAVRVIDILDAWREKDTWVSEWESKEEMAAHVAVIIERYLSATAVPVAPSSAVFNQLIDAFTAASIDAHVSREHDQDWNDCGAAVCFDSRALIKRARAPVVTEEPIVAVPAVVGDAREITQQMVDLAHDIGRYLILGGVSDAAAHDVAHNVITKAFTAYANQRYRAGVQDAAKLADERSRRNGVFSDAASDTAAQASAAVLAEDIRALLQESE